MQLFSFSKLIFRDYHLDCFFNLRIFDHYWRNKEDAFCTIYGINVGVGGTVTPVKPCIVPDLVKQTHSLSTHSNKTFSHNNLTTVAYHFSYKIIKKELYTRYYLQK